MHRKTGINRFDCTKSTLTLHATVDSTTASIAAAAAAAIHSIEQFKSTTVPYDVQSVLDIYKCFLVVILVVIIDNDDLSHAHTTSTSSTATETWKFHEFSTHDVLLR